MVTFDKEMLKNILITENYYFEAMADKMIVLLNDVDDKLQDVFDAWYESRIIKEFSIEGVSIELIMKKKRCNFYYALLNMNLFINDPQKAKIFKNIPFI